MVTGPLPCATAPLPKLLTALVARLDLHVLLVRVAAVHGISSCTQKGFSGRRRHLLDTPRHAARHVEARTPPKAPGPGDKPLRTPPGLVQAAVEGTAAWTRTSGRGSSATSG